MTDDAEAAARERFARHDAWQRSLRDLSWAEKVRMAEAVRESVATLRALRPVSPGSPPAYGEDGEGGDSETNGGAGRGARPLGRP